MTLPALATLAYRCDAAQRLTGIADQAGNTVSYTLGAAGNRSAEQIKDPRWGARAAEIVSAMTAE